MGISFNNLVGARGNQEQRSCIHSILCSFYSNYVFPFNRVDFENIKKIPILVLDVNEEFKNNKIKQEYLIDKVSIKRWGICICFSSAVMHAVTPPEVGGRVNNHLRKQGGNTEIPSVKTMFTSSKERQDLGSKCQKKFLWSCLASPWEKKHLLLIPKCMRKCSPSKPYKPFSSSCSGSSIWDYWRMTPLSQV